MDMALNLNVTQHAQGFPLDPTLLSDHDVTVSFSFLVRSEGAAGSTTQRQSRNLSLQAGVVMAAGKIGLGLRCPYRVEVTARIWQNERLLVEKKEQMACAG
ncbi:curli-like amyloid fiber formation chaperone CsgH [Aeromonas veronii]|uniref:curli-like amyloid fiber formation chaperone CsgH n=1 Tax=Aeromonas veronii TaxID=654 RepID=UPI0038DF399F